MARVAQTCGGIEPNYDTLSRPPAAKSHENGNLRSQGRMLIFRKNVPEGFKSCFDTATAWSRSCASGIFRNFGKRLDLRRVMAISFQQKNFSPNVIYFVVGH